MPRIATIRPKIAMANENIQARIVTLVSGQPLASK